MHNTVKHKSFNTLNFKFQPYKFRHQSAILRAFNKNKGSNVQHVLWVLVAVTLIYKIKELIFINFPDDGTLVPKHVGVGAFYDLCFTVFYLVYFVG